MKKTLLATAMLFASTLLAAASGTHAGGHGHDDAQAAGPDMMTVGKAGEASKATRTIKVLLKETEDGGMRFDPDRIAVKLNETIIFDVENTGETDHEFVLDDHEGMVKHKALMEKFPEMEHDDPNAVRLAPGEKGQVIWTFTNAGEFEFGCLIPGHMDAGMHGPLTVN